MDIAYELARYISNAGFGTLGSTVFAAQIPADQNGIYVVRTGGLPNKYNSIEETVLDVYCKNTKAETCIDTLEDVKRFIHRMHNTSTLNAYIYSILVISDVDDVARDLEYAKVYKITVQVLHRSTGVIS